MLEKRLGLKIAKLTFISETENCYISKLYEDKGVFVKEYYKYDLRVSNHPTFTILPSNKLRTYK